MLPQELHGEPMRAAHVEERAHSQRQSEVQQHWIELARSGGVKTAVVAPLRV